MKRKGIHIAVETCRRLGAKLKIAGQGCQKVEGGGIAEREKVLATIRADRDARVAAALAGIKVPGVVIVGGSGPDGKGANLTETLMNVLLLKSTGVLPELAK